MLQANAILDDRFGMAGWGGLGKSSGVQMGENATNNTDKAGRKDEMR